MRTTSRSGKRRDQVVDGGEVDRGVLADRGVRAAAGLDADDALEGQGLGAHQELGVLAGVDVVGDRGDRPAVAHALAELVHQRGLAGADRTADADAERAVRRFARPCRPCVVLPSGGACCTALRGGRKTPGRARDRAVTRLRTRAQKVKPLILQFFSLRVNPLLANGSDDRSVEGDAVVAVAGEEALGHLGEAPAAGRAGARTPRRRRSGPRARAAGTGGAPGRAATRAGMRSCSQATSTTPSRARSERTIPASSSLWKRTSIARPSSAASGLTVCFGRREAPAPGLSARDATIVVGVASAGCAKRPSTGAKRRASAPARCQPRVVSDSASTFPLDRRP